MYKTKKDHPTSPVFVFLSPLLSFSQPLTLCPEKETNLSVISYNASPLYNIAGFLNTSKKKKNLITKYIYIKTSSLS
jgi:hypothetical protein